VRADALVWDVDAYAGHLSNLEFKDNLLGSVYIATAPGLNVVKFKSWKGDMGALRSRYVTYYGEATQIWAFATGDRTLAERVCHERLAPQRICDELFAPEHLVHVVLEVCGGDCLVCPTEPVAASV
jgi:hypothetical protein